MNGADRIVGYVVRWKDRDGTLAGYRDATGGCSREVFATRAQAVKVRDQVGRALRWNEPGDCGRVVLRVVRRPMARPIVGYIVRKRHPHVFRTKLQAIVQAAVFGDCKVVAIRAGHEALGVSK